MFRLLLCWVVTTLAKLVVLTPKHGEWLDEHQAEALFVTFQLTDPELHVPEDMFVRITAWTGLVEHVFFQNDTSPFAWAKVPNHNSLGGHLVVLELVRWADSSVVAQQKVGFFLESSNQSPGSVLDAAVESHYNQHPYPRNTPLSNISQIDVDPALALRLATHYIFRGSRKITNSTRILIAGGGIGDEAVALRLFLDSVNLTETSIVVLDASDQPLQIARESARALGIHQGIDFIHGSLLDYSLLSRLGKFDLILAIGVLHHLQQPTDGLRTLGMALREGGGIFGMVYGTIGRFGVDAAASLLKLLQIPVPDSSRNDPNSLRLLSRIFEALPASSPLRQNPAVAAHFKSLTGAKAQMHSLDPATEIADTLFHPRANSFTVEELSRFCEDSGMRLLGLWRPLQYDAMHHITDHTVRNIFSSLSAADRIQAGELFLGNIPKHFFFAARQGDFEAGVANRTFENAVPIWTGDAFAERIDAEHSGTLRVRCNGHIVKFPLDPDVKRLLRLVNNKNTIRDMFHLYTQASSSRAPESVTDPNAPIAEEQWAAFLKVWDRAWSIVSGLDWMTISSRDHAVNPSVLDPPTDSTFENPFDILGQWALEHPTFVLLLTAVMVQLVWYIVTSFRIRRRRKAKPKAA